MSDYTMQFSSQYTQEQLIQQIAEQSPNQEVALALLFGAQSESNQNPNEIGYYSGQYGYGAFQFTPPSSYGLTPQTALNPEDAVKAILPSYEQAAQQAPSNLTQPALSEWIALSAEKPLDYTQELAQIASTNQLTQYGAASQENPSSNYQLAVQELAQYGSSLPNTSSSTTSTSGNNASSSGSGNLNPATSNNTGRAKQAIASAADNLLNPTLTLAPTKSSSAPGWSWNPITDVEHIASDITGGIESVPNDLDRIAVNAEKIVVAGIARFGLVILGIMIMLIGVWVIVLPEVSKHSGEIAEIAGAVAA